MDETCYKQRMPAHLGGGERPIYFAPLIKNEFINHDLVFMKNIKGLVVLKASPLEIDSKRIQDMDLKVHRLFSSSEKSWEMAERIKPQPHDDPSAILRRTHEEFSSCLCARRKI